MTGERNKKKKLIKKGDVYDTFNFQMLYEILYLNEARAQKEKKIGGMILMHSFL